MEILKFKQRIEPLINEYKIVDEEIEKVNEKIKELPSRTKWEKREYYELWNLPNDEFGTLVDQLNRLNLKQQLIEHNLQLCLKDCRKDINIILSKYVGKQWRNPLKDKIIEEIKNAIGINFSVGKNDCIYISYNNCFKLLQEQIYLADKTIKVLNEFEIDYIIDYDRKIDEIYKLKTEMDEIVEKYCKKKKELSENVPDDIFQKILYEYKYKL